MTAQLPDFDRKYRQIAFWTIAAVTVVGALLVVSPFFPAIMWAAVLSVLTWPIYTKLKNRFSPAMGATLTVLGTLTLIVLPLIVIGAMVTVRVTGFVQEMDANAPASEKGITIEHVLDRIDETVKQPLKNFGIDFDISEWYTANKKDILAGIRAPLGKAVTGAITTIMTLIIALLTMFFMLRDGHRLREPALELIPLPRAKAEMVLARMTQTIRAVFIGVVLVALAQGALAGLAYWATGVPNWFIWMFATTILCVIPLLGAPIIYVPLAIVMASAGQYVEAGILLAAGFLIISQIDNILRPFLIGARTDQHYMAIFFSLLGGVLLWGPVGLMAGPVLLTVLLALQDIIREARKDGSILEPAAGT